MAASMFFMNKVPSGIATYSKNGSVLMPYPEEFVQWPEAKSFMSRCSVRDVIDRWPLYLFMGTPSSPGSLSGLTKFEFPLDAPLEDQDLAAVIDSDIVAAQGSGFSFTTVGGLFRKYIINVENDTDFTMVVEFNGNWLPIVEQRFYGELLVVDVPAMIAAHEANPDLDQTPAEKLREYMRTGTYPPGTFAFDTFYLHWINVDEARQFMRPKTTDKPMNLKPINLQTTSWVDFQQLGCAELVGRGSGQAYSYFSNISNGNGSRLVNQPVVMPDGQVLYDTQYLEPDWKRSIASGPTPTGNLAYMPWHQTCDRQACRTIAMRRAAAFRNNGNIATGIMFVLYKYPPCLENAIADWFVSDAWKEIYNADPERLAYLDEKARIKREELEEQFTQEQQEREERERRMLTKRDIEEERQSQERRAEQERQRLEEEQRAADELARQAEQDRQQAEMETALLINNLITEEDENAVEAIVVQLEDTVEQIILAEQDERDAQIQSHEISAAQLEEDYRTAEENVARLEELQEQIAGDDSNTLKEEIVQQIDNNLAIMEAADEELSIINKEIDEQLAERDILDTQLDSLPEDLDKQIEILIDESSTTTDDGPNIITIIIIIAIVLGCVWLGFYLRKKSMEQSQLSTRYQSTSLTNTTT